MDSIKKTLNNPPQKRLRMFFQRKPFPAPCRVQTALSIYCDLTAFPNRNTAKRFAPLVSNEADRDALFALVQDREAYQVGQFLFDFFCVICWWRFVGVFLVSGYL